MTNPITHVLTLLSSDPALKTGEGPTPRSFWLPEGASTFAEQNDWVFHFINYINYFFFFLVVGLTVYFTWKYRQRGREVYARGPSHNTLLELGWTILPTLLVVVIFFMGFRGFASMKSVPANAYQIDVTALRYGWVFKYPNGATSEDLYVPAGKPVKLVMRSEDVLHSLYIRDFRVKQDVVPGRYTTLWFQADTPTEGDKFHHLFCTEFCGVGHSNMNRKVFVLNETDFSSWVTEQGRWLDKIAPEELYFKAGPKLYARCAGCHTLDGKPGTGPSWGNYDGSGNVWQRSNAANSTHKVDGKPISDLIGTGKAFENAQSYLRNSILNPNEHIVEGFGPAMPTFRGQLNDKAIDALIGMMQHLDEFDAKGNWIKKDGGSAAPAAK